MANKKTVSLKLPFERIPQPEPELFSSDISLLDYIHGAWGVVEPWTEFIPNWHIDCIAAHLEAVSSGVIKRLIINQPPRSMKSLLVSVCWPTWCWIRQPHLRFMFASYSASLSTFHSLLRRNILRSDWYLGNWGDIVKLRSDQNMKTEFANTQGGMMIATSVGGTAIGKGGDMLVFDDPLNPTEAASPAMRETANLWIRQSFLTRLNNQKTGRIVGVMQRLHEEDTTGMLLGLGGWQHLCLPAEAEGRQEISVGGRIWVREPGDLLCPEREGAEELARKKVELGSYGYAGQYQQRPAPSEGGMLKKHWWRFWYPHESSVPPPVRLRREDGAFRECAQAPLPERFDETLLSWDMAFKGSSSSDYVVGQYWGRRGAEKYLIAQVRQQADFPATIRLMLQMLRQYPEAGAVLVEDKANGPAVMQVLCREVANLIAVNPDGGKEARAHAVSPSIEAGNVYLPHPTLHPWVSDFIERAGAFPNAAWDDELDAMTQALLRLKKHDIPWPEYEEEPLSEDEAWQRTLIKLGGFQKDEVSPGW